MASKNNAAADAAPTDQQAQNDALTTEITQLKAQAISDSAASLNDRTTLAAANAELSNLNDQLTAEKGELAGELNEAQALIEDLNQRLVKANTVAAEGGVVVVSDGVDDYRVLAPKFQHKHVQYTAESLRGNEELVRELVRADVGFLQKVEAKQKIEEKK